MTTTITIMKTFIIYNHSDVADGDAADNWVDIDGVSNTQNTLQDVKLISV